MNKRELARQIIGLRRLLIAGLIADLKDEHAEHVKLHDEFVRNAKARPVVLLLLTEGLNKRVVDPATRKISREGILAQSPKARGPVD